MRILKKVAACLLVVVMTVSAAGCGSEKKEITDGMEIVPVERFSQVEKIAFVK